MAAPTVVLFLLTKTQAFHLIRPVFALGTFPSRGRLEEAFSFLVVQFFDRLTRPGSFAGALALLSYTLSFGSRRRQAQSERRATSRSKCSSFFSPSTATENSRVEPSRKRKITTG